MNRIVFTVAAASLSLFSAGLTSCSKDGGGGGGGKMVIQNIGSDTMSNLAQAWAETYHKSRPEVSVEVTGGGSGKGIAALIDGTCDIANSSRQLEPKEKERAEAKGGHPAEYQVGWDALSIYVHKDNPLNEISMEELKEIYKDGGTITLWSQLGIAAPGGRDEIVCVSRQNNSGTYKYFQESVLGKEVAFRQGTLDLNGSKDVVEACSKSINAIGYSGLGYATSSVKILKVSKKKGEPAISPGIATTLDKTYPISRPLFMYTPGAPGKEVKAYLEWVLSDEGQKVEVEMGYVPLKPQ